ncbi:MAG: hypothetical protein IJC18_00580, partial [Clostridia bacterium]|nr:hypothetical protein [Clostridia bacterium]
TMFFDFFGNDYVIALSAVSHYNDTFICQFIGKVSRVIRFLIMCASAKRQQHNKHRNRASQGKTNRTHKYTPQIIPVIYYIKFAQAKKLFLLYHNRAPKAIAPTADFAVGAVSSLLLSRALYS